MSKKKEPWQIWVDTGGTFTDCIAIAPDGEHKVVKVLSSSALRGKILSGSGADNAYHIQQQWSAPDDFIKGFSFSLLEESDVSAKVTSFDVNRSVITLDRSLQLPDRPVSFQVQSEEEVPVLAARLATRTPSDQPLPPINMRLGTTKATNALLEKKGAPTVLFVTKGYGGLLEIGNQQRPDLFALNIQKREPIYEHVIEVPGRLDAEGKVLQELDFSELEASVNELLKKGITSAAVAFMHSYKNGAHERKFGQWLLDKGFKHVSISSELSPFIKIISRAETTLVNAYLLPIVQQYLDNVHSSIGDQQLLVMTSAGGLTAKDQFAPKDSLLSGPAGGVVGAASAGKKAAFEQVISFDMGGTSTDVARYNADFDYVFEHNIADVHLVASALNIETVAAGGGSICYFDGYKLCVGPESAGAFPGPACYGAGGPLTITDVNLLLGRLDPQNFHIPVDLDAAQNELEDLRAQIQAEQSESVATQEILSGFLRVANERMADAIRKVSVRKGYDSREYAMVAFGGAGGQHACAVARRLGIKQVVIPKEAGLLSASGIGHAKVEEFAETQILQSLEEVEHKLDTIVDRLAQQAKQKLKNVGISQQKITGQRCLLSMRLEGQEKAIEIEYESSIDVEKKFRKAYKAQYGHWISGRSIEVVSLRVIAARIGREQELENGVERQGSPEPLFEKSIWFEGGEMPTPVFEREQLQPGHKLKGPALVLDPYSTIVIEPDWTAAVNEQEALLMEYKEQQKTRQDEGAKVVKLELFTNRFSSIATEMGEMLQRTAMSVNVKDRLDFSCALLNAEGELVVNAPHIPVHLGALGLCVRNINEHLAMEPDDVVVTNHPAFGGSHLPDVTVVTPIFIDGDQLIGYAASRAHHAEIGGITPGSMPPTATNLQQEGVVIPPMYAVKEGVEQWQKIRGHLLSAKYPTRNADENIADMQAAVAANHRGVKQVQELCYKHGVQEVQYHMNSIRKHAEAKMKQTISNIPSGHYESEELLDDDTPLTVSIEVRDQSMAIDFTGTGQVHKNNLNATPAIVQSVVMYVLRLLVDEPIPLNEGLLSPIEITLPTCLLNPDFDADPAQSPAVVGGNIEISQRLVDTLLKPFERIACSQGTMNNVLFGNDEFGYYETVGGGTGAGPDFDGADAVHHHMTNTRGTDPEILEYRYPVRLDEYRIREGSGGVGQYDGGSGIIRKMTFLEPVELTILTQHRKYQPYGLQGGAPGKTGEQWVIRSNDTREQLQAVDGRTLEAGDQFILKTPGGGGFGGS